VGELFASQIRSPELLSADLADTQLLNAAHGRATPAAAAAKAMAQEFLLFNCQRISANETHTGQWSLTINHYL